MFELIDWQIISYQEAWELQEILFKTAIDTKLAGKSVTNKLIFCEHPHVYTLGKHGKVENMLLTSERLEQLNATLVQTNRGGDITYHGYGQLVGYPIFDIASFGLGLKQYIYNVEEAIIRTVATYNIKAERLQGATGVWIDVGKPTCRKIAAIGVRSSQYVTMHGFALNINTDLSYFAAINPCGFIDKAVTSMQKELNRNVDIVKVKEEIVLHFKKLFS